MWWSMSAPTGRIDGQPASLFRSITLDRLGEVGNATIPGDSTTQVGSAEERAFRRNANRRHERYMWVVKLHLEGNCSGQIIMPRSFSGSEQIRTHPRFGSINKLAMPVENQPN